MWFKAVNIIGNVVAVIIIIIINVLLLAAMAEWRGMAACFFTCILHYPCLVHQ